ncbi:MAG: inorganic phosphate transporter, partial [Fibrobacter sp.]|nr:inorganic phosphate transporter [Fibrobacter sp.]
MIISIFLSVAIAFIFGLVVQWISRILFTFHFRKNLGSKIGIFGGVAVTSIMYFMLIKGLKGSAIVTPELQAWVNGNTALLLVCSFVFFTILMQVLYWLKVNVFRIIVLIGTFSLAMAFAGND